MFATLRRVFAMIRDRRKETHGHYNRDSLSDGL